MTEETEKYPLNSIKTFMKRSGRIRPHIQDAYDQLRDVYCLQTSDGQINIAEVFPGMTEIVLEIGFGMGAATAIIASEHPEIGFLGIEIHKPGIAKLLSLIKEKNLQNIRIIEADAVETIERRIPDSVFSGVHIFFPDPWPKKKHHKRRLIQAPFVRELIRILKPGGWIYAATDWDHYGKQMTDVFSSFSELERTDGIKINRPVTKFEARGLKADRQISDIIFKKKG